MIDQIEALIAQVQEKNLQTKEDLEAFKREVIGKNGKINQFFEDFKQVPKEQKSAVGKKLNELKQLAESRFLVATERLSDQESDRPFDLSLPGTSDFGGGRHPIFAVQNKIIDVFRRVGFVVEDSPEIEKDWYNFTALHFEADHPARDMQDTFFVQKGAETKDDVVLRTHTSNTQVRIMERNRPPIRAIAPGRVYRNETISVRAHCYFNQIEAFAVDVGMSFADLKQTLLYFAQTMFGKNVTIRLRPSFFPFTEISAEMDISCLICEGKGCAVCKHSGWVEVLGSGMIDPQVLHNCNIDPEKYSGYALGMGVERIAQLMFRVPDLRLYSQNDLRFLQQFQSFA